MSKDQPDRNSTTPDSPVRKALWVVGVLAQVLAVSAFYCAAWHYYLHPIVVSACDAAWPLSITAILCGRAPSFMYGTLAVGVFEGVVIALLIAPFFLMGRGSKGEDHHGL